MVTSSGPDRVNRVLSPVTVRKTKSRIISSAAIPQKVKLQNKHQDAVTNQNIVLEYSLHFLALFI